MENLKKYKTEAFDIMQYFYKAVHEPLIHCLVEFSNHIDEAVLMEAVIYSQKINPLIRCFFDVSKRNPLWQEKNFKGQDMVQVIQVSSNEEEEKIRLLSSNIDILNGPQLKIYILRKENADSLCIIISHMLCDGGGFKEYLYTLSKIYTKLKNNSDLPKIKSETRSVNQIFNNFKFSEKLGILFSKNELTKQKNQARYSLEGDEDNPLFVTNQIKREEFIKIKTYAKTQGVTVNDMIIAAYIQVLFKKTGEERIIIPCPVDLRKYLNKGQRHGICNLTSNFICDVMVKEDTTFKDTLKKVSEQMKKQKSTNYCLKPVMMLSLIFSILPFNLMKKIFHKFFTIPVTSYTNFGVIDKDQFNFDNLEINNMYLTGAIKQVPYFQIAVSTYNDVCTLSCNLYGTLNDKNEIEGFLIEMKKMIFNNIV